MKNVKALIIHSNNCDHESLVDYDEMMDEIFKQLDNRNNPSNPANQARAGYYAALKLHGIAPKQVKL